MRELWDDLAIVDDASHLAFIKKKPKVAAALAGFTDDEVLGAIHAVRGATPGTERSVKEIELEALLAAPEGYGDDVPVDENFHARRLPDSVWRRSERSAGIESVIQLHRLREVLALAGFTRFEAVTPDIHGEYESDVERAAIAMEPGSFPAVENRGEGLFLRLRGDAVDAWLQRPAVRERLDALERGHARWALTRKHARPFPGGPYVLLHTLSHLLIQSLAMHCGYPASSLRERVYAEDGRYGLLIYTGSPDAEGTLGGLVQQARRLDEHLLRALEAGGLCSNDPTCADHSPGESMAERWLHGAACHGCALVAETSCEIHNDYLDRALVVPVLGVPDAAFFGPRGMIELLLALPSHLRKRLESALEAGTLRPPYRPVAVRAALGGAPESDAVAGALAELTGLGVSGPACAAWLNSFDRTVGRRSAPDFVWSGPEVAGLHARDTRRVYDELLGSAARSAWVATYAFFDGPKAFEVLARRMDNTPGLAVTLLLNVQRRKGDTTGADHLVRRFGDRFWEKEWPGAARPRVFYDPRSLDPADGAGVLHAKAVVVDDEAVFVTSANLTEGGARPEHRDRPPRPRPRLGRDRDPPLHDAHRAFAAAAVAGGDSHLE